MTALPICLLMGLALVVALGAPGRPEGRSPGEEARRGLGEAAAQVDGTTLSAAQPAARRQADFHHGLIGHVVLAGVAHESQV